MITLKDYQLQMLPNDLTLPRGDLKIVRLQRESRSDVTEISRGQRPR